MHCPHSWQILVTFVNKRESSPCAGDTRSEGGFAANKVSVASLLDVQTAKDKKGKS